MGKIKIKMAGRQRNLFRNMGVIFAILLLIAFTGTLAFAATLDPEKQKPDKELLQKVLRIQVPFIANQGQIADEKVRFYAKTFGGGFYITESGEMVYSLTMVEPKSRPKDKHSRKPSRNEIVKTWVLKEELVGALSPMPRGVGESKTKVNYFIGSDPSKWKKNLSTYNTVSLGEVYEGIGLSLKAYGKNVEKIFTVKPGAEPHAIKLRMEGASSLKVNEQGELEAETGLGIVRFSKPLVYQEISGKRVDVKGAYNLENSELSTPNSVLSPQHTALVYGFKVGNYDKSSPLIIDPICLTCNSLAYSTYLGGSDDDEGIGIAVDSAGNAYVTGYTYSFNSEGSGGFPTKNPVQDHNAGDSDAFVAKINPSASGDPSLVYSTYLGGSSSEYSYGIAVDSAGNAYVTGYTYSTDFPVTPGAFQTSSHFDCEVCYGADAFVAKLNASGSALMYSTYLGGSADDGGSGIAVDSAGNAYITGRTNSTDFPSKTGAFQITGGGDFYDAFVTKLNASGSALVYSTYLGGSDDDEGIGIAVDSSRNAYVTGYTYSFNSEGSVGFPTKNAFQADNNGGYDAFVTKLTVGGNGLVYSTYLGGINDDYGSGIAVDSSGNAYLTGSTYSTDFPITPGAFQSLWNNCSGESCPYVSDAFVTKLSSDGSALLYSTYLGGRDEDWGQGIAVDSSGNAYVTGYTYSADFPIKNAFQSIWGNCSSPECASGPDAFMTKINPGGTGGSDLVYSTYLGGSADDEGSGIAVDSAGNAYVLGVTSSSNFPKTATAYQESHQGGVDSFIAKFTPLAIIAIDPNFGGEGINFTITGGGFQSGATVELSKFVVINSSNQTSIGATIDTISSTQITGTFDLTGAPIGQYDVVVTNPDGQSAILPKGFTVLGPPVTTAYPVSGTYNAPLKVTLKTNEPATVYYTTDGSTPTAGSKQYSGPITISATTTLKFFARVIYGIPPVNHDEAVNTEHYKIDTRFKVIVQPPTNVNPGDPMPVMSTFTFPAGTHAIVVDCYKVNHILRDFSGKPLPPMDHLKLYVIGDPDALGSDVKTYSGPVPVTCDLKDLYPPEVLVPGTYTLEVTYSNFFEPDEIQLFTGTISAPAVSVIVGEKTPTHTIKAKAGLHGSIDPSGSIAVPDGGSLTFNMAADPHYHIAKVRVDGYGKGAISSYPFNTVTKNHTIQATFAIDTFVITTQPGTGGTISPSNPKVKYGHNKTFKIIPKTAYGYKVYDVKIDGVSVMDKVTFVGTVGSYTFPVDRKHTISATFAK